MIDSQSDIKRNKRPPAMFAQTRKEDIRTLHTKCESSQKCQRNVNVFSHCAIFTAFWPFPLRAEGRGPRTAGKRPNSAGKSNTSNLWQCSTQMVRCSRLFAWRCVRSCLSRFVVPHNFYHSAISKHVVRARIMVEMGSHPTKRVPVQSHNSFLNQRSRKVIM